MASVVLAFPIAVLVCFLRQSYAANCDASSFGVLATSPTVGYCMRDSNVSFLALPEAPTDEQLAEICRTPTCRQMLKILLALNPVECEIPLGSRIKLRAELMDPAVTYCASHDVDVTAAAETMPPSTSNYSGVVQDDHSARSPAARSLSRDARSRGMITLGTLVLALIICL